MIMRLTARLADDGKIDVCKKQVQEVPASCNQSSEITFKNMLEVNAINISFIHDVVVYFDDGDCKLYWRKNYGKRSCS